MARSRSSGGSISHRSSKRLSKHPGKGFNRSLMRSLSRPEPFRDKRRAILIALEDEKSARLYFESFREKLKKHRVVVIAPHTGSAPKSVIAAARQAKIERQKESEQGLADEFDEVWVVFDTEGPQNAQRQNEARNAIDQAHQLKFRTAVSNPSFEYWLLLHYIWHVHPILSGKAACTLLRSHISRYRKGMNCFDITYDKIRTAIMHAERVFKERCENLSEHPCDCHPCTEVHHLAESLLSEL
jgi:RloB-like protein